MMTTDPTRLKAVFNHLDTAHTWMLEYQNKHAIVSDIKNLDWFEIMGVLAMARREIEEP